MSNEDAVNDWELGSGLDLDGAKVEITSCEFGFNNEIAAGVVCANMEFTPIDGGGDPIKQSFSVGKGWEADRTGENLVTESGKQRKLNMTSNFGRLLASAIEILGSKETAAEVLGSPRHAPNWVGTMWEMGTYTREVMNPTTKATKESIGFIFVDYLGDGIGDGGEDEEETPKTAAKTTGKRSGTTRTGTGTSRVGKKAAAGGPPEGIDDDLWTELVDLAVEVMNRDEDNQHEDFANEAIDSVEGVDGNKAAEKACMGSKAGSVWAAAVAKNKASE